MESGRETGCAWPRRSFPKPGRGDLSIGKGIKAYFLQERCGGR